MLPVLLCAALLAPPQANPSRNALAERIDARLAAEREGLIALRHALHRWPELSGDEERTAAAVAQALAPLGLELRTEIAGHGLVAVLRGAGPGPVIGFRADMDAVRSGAPDPGPVRSERPGIRHACGHDLHTAVGVALAHALDEVRDAFGGTVVLLFQPAEETASGARAMIAAGAIDDPRPEEWFAYHAAPLPVGTLGVTPGRALPARDPFVVELSGAGDLAAAAERVRAVLVAANTFEDPWSAPSQTEDFLVVAAGPPARVGERWVVRGQATVSSEAARTTLRRLVERELAALREQGIEGTLEVDAARTPGVHNDPELVAAIEGPLRAVVGEDGLVVGEGVPPQFSEDFGAFQETAPGVMLWLGVAGGAPGTSGRPHAPDFVADDGAIEAGARAMAAVLLARLERR